MVAMPPVCKFCVTESDVALSGVDTGIPDVAFISGAD